MADMLVVLMCFFFFFSSRRRHTRLQGDWSSDVCSSDLQLACALGDQAVDEFGGIARGAKAPDQHGGAVLDARQRLGDGVGDFVDHLLVSGMQAAGAALKCSYVEQKFAERIIEPWKKMPLP